VCRAAEVEFASSVGCKRAVQVRLLGSPTAFSTVSDRFSRSPGSFEMCTFFQRGFLGWFFKDPTDSFAAMSSADRTSPMGRLAALRIPIAWPGTCCLHRLTSS
jgi:hypothetical protein